MQPSSLRNANIVKPIVLSSYPLLSSNISIDILTRPETPQHHQIQETQQYHNCL